MKTRYNTYDIVCCVTELQRLVGMRVNNVYDIDSKTYLIRLQRGEDKNILLLESGTRFHTTNFEWPKNVAPSGFSMKMRKHLKNKRLESLTQLGTDRIIDLQFGSGEAAYHVILELYDKGNIILTDYERMILNILRPHTEGDKVKFVVREKYPENRAREGISHSIDDIKEILKKAKAGDSLKKVLVSNLEYGPSLLEHVLLKAGFSNSTKINKSFSITDDIEKLMSAINEAQMILESARNVTSRGYIIQKKEERPNPNEEKEYFYSNQEFHPLLYKQHESLSHKEFECFNLAVDEFYSSLESQKIEMRAFHQEREAMKKLENVKKDLDQRLQALEKTQEDHEQKAALITRNQELVENAILAVQTALANQISWPDIKELVKDAASKNDPVAKHIKQLKLETNHISLFLSDPYAEVKSYNERCSDEDEQYESIPSMIVDIDLALTAYANARKYYDQKRSAAKKQQKTIESQSKAFKSAEKKTIQTLKEVQTITNIHKARKVYWFEKFFWFISSENYLVIAGRDQQQNELIVKRYMKPNDIYVHADIHGASSVVVKNPIDQLVPPKTLNEAGTMAICYSTAWEAKVITNAYWVLGEQVSKTAPTGEYLTTGSFMIRGKKNFLPPSHLILGLSFLFRLEDGHIEKHLGERKIIAASEEDSSNAIKTEQSKDEVEIDILDESDEEVKDETEQSGLLDKDKLESEEEDTNMSQNGDESSKFPDTQIKIQHSSENKINIVTQSSVPFDDTENDGEKVVYLGDDKPIIFKPNQRSRNSSESKVKQSTGPKKTEHEEMKPQHSKRGQKSKLKKIKEKYRDQDEEERKLRMEILQSAGAGKDTKKSKKKKESINTKNKNFIKITHSTIKKDVQEGGGIGDDEEISVQADVDMIDALTGIPLPEDELLFAVPVVAPYNTLSNYKYKVKLTPGTGRRGKAARTAVSMFLKDRTATQREKDLLKAVKDEQLARNLPGKVKLSAPRLQIFRK